MEYKNIETTSTKRFRIANVDKSVVNALRRTLVGNIPILVLKPQDCVITVNTTRFTNEIIKARLACIPIHHSSNIFDKFTVSVNHTNHTQQTMYLTTKEFVAEQGGKKYDLFPSYKNTGYDGKSHSCYIEFMRLRPGESLALTCETSIGTANESGMYNSVGTCAYGCAQDKDASDKAYTESDGKESKENWELLNAKRYVIPDTFDFVLQSIGVYTNDQLLQYAIVVMNAQFEQCKLTTLDSIEDSLSTIPNCYDVKITGDYNLKELEVHVDGDYTIGKMLEAQIFTKFNDVDHPITYVAFFKKHPHDKFGILRVAFDGATAKTTLELVQQTCEDCITVLQQLKEVMK
jgi:hypothetical protein